MSTLEHLDVTFFGPIDERWEARLGPLLQLVSSVHPPPGDEDDEAARARSRRRRLRRRRLMRVLAEEVGLQPEHLAGLRWRDVELGKQLLWIPTPHGGRRRVALTKLADHLLERAFRRTRDPLGFVFPRRGRDRPLSVGAVRRILGAAGEVDHG